jgi:hypothetical protein
MIPKSGNRFSDKIVLKLKASDGVAMTFRFARAVFLIASCLTTSSAFAADVVFPTGSKLGLVPPSGLVASESFRGFEDRTNNAAILLVEMPAQAQQEIEKAMTAEGLKKQGVTVDKRETVAIKDGKGLLFIGRQMSDGTKLRKWILVGSTPKTTALVTAIVPESVANLYPDDAIRTALVSLAVRDSVPIDEQMRLLPFKLDDLANLRAFRVESNTVFLTEGPKDELDATEQPLLVVSAAVGGPGENAARDTFARNMFSGVPGFKEVRVVGTDLIRRSGQQTHQILAEGKDSRTGAEVKLVQWLRFGNGAFVRFLGISRAETWTESFTQFRTVRDSFAAR